MRQGGLRGSWYLEERLRAEGLELERMFIGHLETNYVQLGLCEVFPTTPQPHHGWL